MTDKPCQFHAGAAIRDITPASPLFLSGYPNVPRIAAGTHDPLAASALFLSDGATPVLLIGVDILFIARPSVLFCRAAIQKATGIPAGNILVSATHTHSGPVTNEVFAWRDDPAVPPPAAEYLELFHTGIIEAGIAAHAAAQPAELAVTAARAVGAGRNRLDPEGPFDPEVGLLAVRRPRGHELLALDMIYGMHPTVLHEDSKLVSADFPGFARRAIGAQYPGLVCVYHTAPAGNLSPRYDVAEQTFAEAERLGGKLAATVCRSLAELADKDFSANPRLAAASRSVELVPNIFPAVADAEARLKSAVDRYARLKAADAPRGAARTAECEAFGAANALTLARMQAAGQLELPREAYSAAEVQAIKIGDVCLVGLPGEMFVEYALEIKRRAPCRAFVISLASGELQGYIAAEAAYASGGYEAAWAMFKPESGARMVKAALQLMQELT